MFEAEITKHFHRDEGVMKRGDVVREKMRFASHDDMDRFGMQINRNHAVCPYSITNAIRDARNFVMYDMSIIEGIYGTLPWNEVQ